MNARRMLVAVLVIGLLVVGVSVVSAQNGAGYGPGPGTCPTTGEPCPMTPAQMRMGGQFGMGAQTRMNTQMGNGMGMAQMGQGMANCAADGSCAGAQNQMQSQMGGRWGNANTAGMGRAAATPLTDDVAAAMAEGWLDEANAYAAYEQLIAQFGEVIPFVQLQRAEARHMTAWERQFANFGLALPEAPAPVELPTYVTVQEACAAAVAIEEANAGLYDDMLAIFADYPSLTRVATALRSASINRHLPELELCAS